TWSSWALAALVPGLISLLVGPLIIYKLHRPDMTETPESHETGKPNLANLGPVKCPEWMMLGVFVLLLVLWIFAKQLGDLNATTAALVGLAVLLLSGVLTWDD